MVSDRFYIPMTGEILIAVSAFIISLAGAWLALRYTRRAGLLDIPNHRSSHFVPTPRGGGIALVGSVLLVGAYEVVRLGEESRWVFVVLAAAVASLAFVGWMDDRGSLRVGIRLIVHLGCGLAVGVLVNEIAPLSSLANVAWVAWWVFWAVASINIVNFMDGIDGMVAAQGVVYGAFLFSLLPASTLGGRFGLILAAACLGFLIWNWSPAQIFMGDVGSGPLGLFFVIGGALALRRAPAQLVFLPLFPLFFDALATVVIRYRRGEKLTDAHRSHLYQRLANGGYGHARVTSIYAIAAGVGAVLAVWVKDASTGRIAATISVYFLIVVAGWKLLHEKFFEAPVINSPTVADRKL